MSHPFSPSEPAAAATAEAAPAPDAPSRADDLTFAQFQTAVSQSFVPLRVTSRDAEGFHGSVAQTSVHDISFSRVQATEHTVERTEELIRKAPRQYFKVSLQLEGHSVLQQGDVPVELQPGDLAIYDTSRPYTLTFDSPFVVMVVQLPHDKLDIPPAIARHMTGVRVAGDTGLGRVVSPFLATIGANFEQLQGPAGMRLAQNAIDLIETLFAHELDVAKAAADPHTALIRRIRDYIDGKLGSADLTPSTIAADNFISTRHLHGLFHEQGTTVSAYVRSRRLEQCYLNLSNPLLLDTPIAAIGLRWGFSDAAHFSRVFKSAYGESPRDVRARALAR